MTEAVESKSAARTNARPTAGSRLGFHELEHGSSSSSTLALPLALPHQERDAAESTLAAAYESIRRTCRGQGETPYASNYRR